MRRLRSTADRRLPRRNPRSYRRGFFLLGLCVVLTSVGATPQPYIPEDDAAVLLDIPRNAAMLRGLAERQLSENQAVALARLLLAEHRQNGDPRTLGHARGVLQPWWSRDDVAPSTAVIRATLKQAQHDFVGALVDLDRVLRADPQQAQARLTRAVILRVLGRYPEAAQACQALSTDGMTWVAEVCALSIASLQGELEASRRALDDLRPTLPAQPDALQIWYWSEWVDMAVRADDAVALDTRLPVLLERFSQHLGLRLQALEWWWLQQDGASIRRFAREDSASIDERMYVLAATSAEAMTDDVVPAAGSAHQRARAVGLLALGQNAAARDAARSNWAQQREPADARVLALAAARAGDADQRQRLARWQQAQGLEDAVLQQLLSSTVAP